jgi:hypothetical protein
MEPERIPPCHRKAGIEYTLEENARPRFRGRLPRVARLMALALQFEALIQEGWIRDYADLARLGRVSRARITQIMNLLNLCPDIQEQLLFLPPAIRGRDAIHESALREIAKVPEWEQQRRLLAGLLGNQPLSQKLPLASAQDAEAPHDAQCDRLFSFTHT